MRLSGVMTYAERSADTLESPAIRKQTKKLMRFMPGELARLRGKPETKK